MVGNNAMRLLASLLLGTGLALASVASATAGPLTATAILQDFNAIIYRNASSQSDIEGAAVIGGNFSRATLYNNPTATQPAGYGALTVYGSTGGNSINIDNGGRAYVGGSKGAPVNFNGGGGYIAAPGNSIADFESQLDALSTSLSQLAATGSLPKTDNNEVINAIAGASGIAVFDLTAAQLAAIPSFSVNLNGASTVVFNVDGSSVSFNADDQSGSNGAGNIIWNFYDATGGVAINTLIGGSVLAPLASVTNNNQIDGALVARQWAGGGELHDVPFTGKVPSDPTSVPEPGSITLLAGAAITLTLLRRRHRAT